MMTNMLLIVSILFFILGIILLILKIVASKNTNLVPKEKDTLSSFCVLIPAREESRVIRGLLESIKNQVKQPRMEDVYVIVERDDDPSVFICKEYGVSVVVRKHLDLRRKGYALDEAVQEILTSKKKYDAYFIFDADNILDPNFFLEMEKSYQEGYDVAISYRGCKNGNDSFIAACSTLTFSMINTIGNRRKAKKNQALTLSGTGFYIKGTLVEKWGCYPFHSLTEDYELSLYMVLHGLTSTYNENAIFYDEQPIDYKTTVRQRTRWIRGYMDVRKEYIPLLKNAKKEKNDSSIRVSLIGVWPYLLMIIGILLFLLTELISVHKIVAFQLIGVILLFVYLFLVVFTIILLYQENGRLGFSKKSIFLVVLFNPIFLASYIPCAIRALFSRNLEWKKIEHIH